MDNHRGTRGRHEDDPMHDGGRHSALLPSLEATADLNGTLKFLNNGSDYRAKLRRESQRAYSGCWITA